MAVRVGIFARVVGRATQCMSHIVSASHTRTSQILTQPACTKFFNGQVFGRNLSCLSPQWTSGTNRLTHKLASFPSTDNRLLLQASHLQLLLNVQPHRNHIRYSMNKGKRKTVRAAVKRFYRLEWGGWIRTRAGRVSKLWKKGCKTRKRMRQHVFCNPTQNQLLDFMMTDFWKKPKYYVDDPYEPYQVRHGLYRKAPRNPY